RERKSVWKAFMLPMEFKETDERERMITAKACRGSYVVMMFAMPIAAGLLIMYPTIQDTLPYYPIIIVILLLLIQMISYFYTLHKDCSKVSGLYLLYGFHSLLFGKNAGLTKKEGFIMDAVCKTNQGVFNFRTAGLRINNNRVLLHRIVGDD